MIQAVLTNNQHPEYGVVTVPFPIPREEYDHMMELLSPLEIGDSVARDCRVDEISSEYPILKRLEKGAINIDELDYLAKRLESFNQNELAKVDSEDKVITFIIDKTTRIVTEVYINCNNNKAMDDLDIVSFN